MKISIFLLFVVLFFSCQNKKQGEKDIILEKNNSLVSIAFNNEMDSLYQLGIYNGYSVAIVDSSGILYNQGFGYADVKNKKKYTKNTLINIASISKVFIGVSLLKAQEMKLINLDDPINKYFPLML